MLRRALLPALMAVACCAAAAQEGESFMVQLQEASAVAPLRMRGGTPTAILPGHFRNARRADAVVIADDDQASLCRGPDYKKCVPLGSLPARRTVATTIGGESKLLVFDSLSSARICTVDAAEHRASMDCRTVDFSKLAAYNLKFEGHVLTVQGTDGMYFCTATDSPVRCAQITTADGSSAIRKQRAERRAFGAGAFTPLDQPDKRCLVRDGAIHCTDRQKLSDFMERPLRVGPWMQPVLLIEDDDYNNSRVDLALDRVYVTGNHDPSGGLTQGYWGANGHLNYTTGGGGGYGVPVGSSMGRVTFGSQPTPDPQYYYKQCMEICNQQNEDYRAICIGAGAFFMVFGAYAGATAFAVCEAGRAYHDWYCRNGLCGR